MLIVTSAVCCGPLYNMMEDEYTIRLLFVLLFIVRSYGYCLCLKLTSLYFYS